MSERRGWPASLVVVADAIGDEAALTLVKRMGGTRLRIPRHPRSGSNLTEAIGLPAARMLADMLWGAEIEIPTVAVRSKKLAILRSIEEGGSTLDIARKHGVCTRYVRRLKSLSSSCN